MIKKTGLGRGLEALFSEREVETSSNSVDKEKDISEIEINKIRPNKSQPRTVFNEEKLKELSGSIKKNGLIQPIIVQRTEGGYALISGERRLMAVKIAGLKKIPAIVRENIDEQKNALFALIENIQREDLNPLDEAFAFYSIKNKFKLTQEKLAEITGKGRAYIANSLRILTHTNKIKEFIKNGDLSIGHAKVLLSIKDNKKKEKLAEKTVRENLSVRDLENLIKKTEQNKKQVEKKEKKNQEIIDIEEALTDVYKTIVKINIDKKFKGKIQFEFYDREELEELIDNLTEEK
ncbi:MAG: ParB/RepB/Spo0J family partition protein [Clostridiales Family XIII bacterium]|nr:ParB/RepB/Spo0J family partition protein [Clostridiales Family XIII bacterium]